MKTALSGGCYILDPVAPDAGELKLLIGTDFGAMYLNQYVLDLKGSASPVYTFGSADVVVFAAKGRALATVSGREFEMPSHSGLHVRPGEAFRIEPEGDFRCLITVCPEAGGRTELEGMPENFNGDFPRRVAEIDPAKKEAMADRFFQVLVSKGLGSRLVTQFIGEIPLSKAPSHYHLYEEALYILDGEGFMWTGDVKGAVKPGSVIFLPKRQEHALECTSDGGLKVVGHFYPAGSPAENY